MEQKGPSCESKKEKKKQKNKKTGKLKRSCRFKDYEQPQYDSYARSTFMHTSNTYALNETTTCLISTTTNSSTLSTKLINLKIDFTLKLLVNTTEKKVLFCETGKEFLDFIFSLMSLPIATIVSLLSCNAVVGSFGRFYNSFEALGNDHCYIVKPNNVELLESMGKRVYSCKYCKAHVSYIESDNCPNCGHKMLYVLPFVEQKSYNSNRAGYANKELITYMVMDDLEVKPMSELSNVIALLNKFEINDEIGVLEERVVSFGVSEGLKLLKASLESKTVLTNVFLK